MVLTKLSFAIFVTTLSVGVSAQTATPTAVDGKPAASSTAKPQKEKKVCQTMQTGSLIPKRVCMTPEEWADFRQKNGLTANEISRTNGTRCTMSNIC